jgi:hypothetical protein
MQQPAKAPMTANAFHNVPMKRLPHESMFPMRQKEAKWYLAWNFHAGPVPADDPRRADILGPKRFLELATAILRLFGVA